jgi:bidirectional [NiFe] hydrogenase diaphorase subunit
MFMLVRTPKIAPPTNDKKWVGVQAVMRQNGYSRDALIETLHAVQKAFGYLDEDSLRYVAASLRVPLSKAYGVSTFYHLFKLKPSGEHTCVICTGTACYLNGIPKMLESIEEKFGLKPGDRTEDGKIEFVDARCVGACGVAPVAIFDGQAAGKLTTEEAVEKLEEWQSDD